MKLLKSGELGTGILVEYDAGHISAKTNKHIIKEIASKSEDNIMMYAVLQKAGVENRNGRVYPRDILQREVDKYQTLIGQGRALSELNHPESSLVDQFLYGFPPSREFSYSGLLKNADTIFL